jgi:hypothetical protein
VGARVAARLKARRDGLPTFARQYYQLLAREAEVYAADQADSVQILRRADRSLDLVLAGPAGPYYRRRFRPSETKEVRVFLKDGDDRALSEGSDGSIKVRLVGGEGNDFLDDSAGGHTRLYDSSGDNRVVKGPGTRTSDRPYTAPLDRVGHPQRDWGSRNEALPHASWSGDYGAILGGTLRRTTFGFRRHPYATRHTLRAGYSTRLTGADVAYEYESLRTDNRTRFAVAAEASSLDVIHFYGFGNETPGAAPEEFNDVTARQIALAPSYRLDVTGIDVTIGPVAKYTDAHPPATSLIGQQRPYGVGRFGQAGARLAVTLDGRDPEMSRALGALVSAEGSFYPPVWSVSESFGEVHGEAALLAAATPVPGRPMLALRVGGKKVFGRYPFQEAAAIGGSRSVRGLPRQRYIGDAAVFGNGELRLTLRDRRGALLPRFVVFGLADAGRVFVEGETSDRWHTGLGGGLWFAVMEPGNLVSLTVARSEGLVRVYLHGGFTF